MQLYKYTSQYLFSKFTYASSKKKDIAHMLGCS